MYLPSNNNNNKDDVVIPIIGLLIMLGVLFCSKVQAAESSNFKLIELQSMGMEYRHIRNYRDAYFPKYETIEGKCVGSTECFKYGANALFDLDLFKYKQYGIFWRNDVHMDATNKQVRHVGWHWEVGFPLVPEKLEVFTRHHSRHVLESEPQIEQNYPLRDEYIMRLNFYKRKK